MLNPEDDTLNPLCQPGPLQQHSGKELGLALAHSLHPHTHAHLSGNTKAGHKEKKAFLLGKKSKQLSHICVCVSECERKGRAKEGGKDTQMHFKDKKRKSSTTSCVRKFKIATK